MKNQDGKTLHFVSHDPSEVLIDALVPEKNNSNVFHRVSFKASVIDHVMQVNDAVSALVLKSNLTIPVAHPFQKLREMIYDPDLSAGQCLDLTPVTGLVVKDALVPALTDEVKLSGEFNQSASLMINAILRKPGTNEVINCSFSAAAVSSYEPLVTNRTKSGSAVAIHFNAAVRDPFGTGKANLDMPYDDFIALLANAKNKGSTTLDLCAMFVANPDKYGFNPA
ncbi:MAG: hypothetical protein HY052_09295 [Proteobacteria bacterium]|nr:hypothetical protein [Pseudomonadota bacterium]